MNQLKQQVCGRREILTGINFGLERFANKVDAGSQVVLLLPILVQFVLIGAQVRQVKLVLFDVNKPTHVGSKLVLKRLEVNETVAIRVQHVLHDQADVTFGGINLVLDQVSLKVLVRDETIAVNVEISEDFEGTGLTLAVRHILNF